MKKFFFRLQKLHQLLSKRNLDGLLVPYADEYQNEYTPSYAKRLAWLTGFTGSAGMSVINSEGASALFVDGRYTLQAKNEVDSRLYEIQSLSLQEIGVWIGVNFTKGKKIGFDARLHSISEIQYVKSVCQKQLVVLKSCEKNFIDKIWINQPKMPTRKMFLHGIQFAGHTEKFKRKKVAKILRRKKCSFFILTSPDSIAWLLNIRGSDVKHTPLCLCFATINSEGEVTLFIDPKKIDRKKRIILGDGVKFMRPGNFDIFLKKIANSKQKILVDKNKTPFSVYQTLILAKANLSFGEDPCLLPRACKNEIEISGARSAHLRDGVSLVKFLSWLYKAVGKKNITELTSTKKLKKLREKNQFFKGLSFETISAVGGHAAIVHYRPSKASDEVIKCGNIFLIDSGAQYLDGTTDVTRTIFVRGGSSKPSNDQKNNFTKVLKGHIAIASATFPFGTKGYQLDPKARKYLKQSGLDYDHGTGHGVGSYLGVHEGPQSISKAKNNVNILPGMILSNEPGYYKADKYGIRIENLITVLENREKKELFFETLTLAPIDRRLINRRMLNVKEINWLNDYHDRVYLSLKDFLDKDQLSWLKRETAPV